MPLILSGTIAAANPVADANALMDQVETLCIQPFAEPAQIMTPPEGWTLIADDSTDDAFEIAMTYWDVLSAIGYTDWSNGLDDAIAQIVEGTQSSRGYAREALAEGEAMLIEHLNGGAQMLVDIASYGTVHAECTLWATTPENPLNDVILDRWALRVPHLLQSPYGSQRYADFTVLVSGKIAEVYVSVTEATPLAGPVPVVLRFGTAPG